MAVPVPVPRLGLAMSGSQVAEWYQADGATVQAGDPICCLECDQVALEIEAEASGILRHRIPQGGVRPPGDVLGVILAQGERMPEFGPAEPFEPSLPVPPTPLADLAETVAATSSVRDEPAAGIAALDEEVRHADAREAPPPLAFRRRFASFETEPEYAWDSVPGDTTDFLTGAWPSPEPSPQDEPRPKVGVIEELAEPGGAIPDLPIWEEPETALIWEPPVELPVRTMSVPVVLPTARQTSALVLRATVGLTETNKMRQQLSHEWRASGLAPTLEDVIVRAAARAWQGIGGADPTVALRRVGDTSEDVAVLSDAGTRPFRQAISAFAASTAEGPEHDFVITTFQGRGIDDATPRLDGGSLALTIGDERTSLALVGDLATPVSVVTLSLAYAPELIADGTAAAFLGRLGELVEAPYALLAE